MSAPSPVAILGATGELGGRVCRLLDAAGVGTLIATPMAFTFDERLDQLRKLAELAG